MVKNNVPLITHVVWIGDDMPPKLREFHERKKHLMPKHVHLVWDQELIEAALLENPNAHGLTMFIRRSIEAGKYAHAADAIKIAAVDMLGGWALDADVEILRSFDTIEAPTNFITGSELWRNRHSLFTAVMGATPYHKFTQRLARYYYQHDPADIWRLANTTWVHRIMRDELGFKEVDQPQTHTLWDVSVLPSNVFCAGTGDEAHAKHYFNGSWL